MPRYEVILSWSSEDSAFIARAPELPGCMAHGASREEALANIQDAMLLWIDTAKEHGDPIPQPRSRLIAV